MNVVVQHLESGLYLAPKANWVKLEAQPLVFGNPVEAITYCIQRSLRSVRLVNNAGVPEEEKFVYPFGEDPTVKAERKRLRRLVAQSRRLKQDKRMLQARVDMMEAEAKERRKQIPFKRKPVAEE
jgi:hypothetical protein